MREHYVRPPLVPREAPAAWRAVWPFRLALLLGVVALTLLLVLLYAHLNDAAGEDPGIGALPALVPLR